jgi:hypothetical protein
MWLAKNGAAGTGSDGAMQSSGPVEVEEFVGNFTVRCGPTLSMTIRRYALSGIRKDAARS